MPIILTGSIILVVSESGSENLAWSLICLPSGKQQKWRHSETIFLHMTKNVNKYDAIKKMTDKNDTFLLHIVFL